MSFKNVSILSVASVVSGERVSTEWIEDQLGPTMDRVGVPRGTIEALTGIKERRFLPPDAMPSDIAAEAGRRALERASLDGSEIQVLINSSVCRDYIEPSTASIVHAKLELEPECVSFDVGNACLGFVNAMDVVASMIERGAIDYGLIVDGENSRRVVSSTIERLQNDAVREDDLRGNFATLTLGSAGAAMVLARSELVTDGHRLLGGVSMSATEYNHLCRGEVDRMETDGMRLMSHGLDLAAQTWARAQRERGVTDAQVSEYVIHQISRGYTQQMTSRLGIDPAKILPIYPELGNIGPASIATNLARAEEAGRLKRGDRVCFLGMGSGLNAMVREVVW